MSVSSSMKLAASLLVVGFVGGVAVGAVLPPSTPPTPAAPVAVAPSMPVPATVADAARSPDPIGSLAAMAVAQAPRPNAQPAATQPSAPQQPAAPTRPQTQPQAQQQPAAPAPQQTAGVQPGATSASAVQWTAGPQRVERQPDLPRIPGVQPVPERRPETAAGQPATGPAATRGSAVTDDEARQRGVIYTRLELVDSGAFRAVGRTIRFADIEPLGADAMCRDPRGREWACGRRAQGALQQLIRGRSVNCVEVSAEGNQTVARCRIGRTDISAWLVEQGWARPATGADRLASLYDEARSSGVGQFGGGSQ